MIIALIIQISILCCRSVARKSPTNYILLFAFTICKAFIFSVICAQYPSSDCMTAAGMTAAVTIALTYYACTTKTDFTMCGGMFFIMAMAMMCLMVVSYFLTFISWWSPFVSALLVVFYGMFLIYDTQKIAGGR